MAVITYGCKDEISCDLKKIITNLKEEIIGVFSMALEDSVNAVETSGEMRREYMILNMRDNEMRIEGKSEGL